MKKTLSLLLVLILAVSLSVLLLASGEEKAAVLTQALDYSDAGNWAYFEMGGDKDADVFLICPTVDVESYANALDVNDNLRSSFLYALDLEKGIYSDTGRLFSPYYRQMSINAYTLPQAEHAQAKANAYLDVSAAFRWYLDHENNGRPLILAGFSQGSEMCFELLKEYFGGSGAEAQALRDRLVAVYGIGWTVTEEMTDACPQIVPAKGETDTGVVISFDCEDGTLTDSLIIPAGETALSINPLNWKTDGSPADRSLNLGAVMGTGAEPIPALCGAYIGNRGELVVTDINAEDYPPGLDIFQPGAYHLYDYMFFFTNLKNNVADRMAAWASGTPFKDVSAGAWYADAIKYVYAAGLMTGTSDATFSPGMELTRAQLVTILWRNAGQPAASGPVSFSDVSEGAWYTEAVRWAIGEKIAEGYGNGLFGTDDPVTREQTVSLLWRLDGRPAAGSTDLSRYQDAGSVSPWAREAAAWAVNRGILRGKGRGLDPQGTATRAEAAQLLMNEQEAGDARPAPAPMEGLSDYIAWAKTTGYSSGTLTPMGSAGINQDYYHTPAGSDAYPSGRIVIGDSRCCQLGIYQQRTGGHDFAAFAVWGGHYLPDGDPPIMTKELLAEVEACFRAQIEACGKCTVYFFPTINDYDYMDNNNEAGISAAIQSAEKLAALSCTVDGKTYHPQVVVIGFDGGRATGKILGIPSDILNRYIPDYNHALLLAVSKSEMLRPFASRFTTVPEIAGGKADFISDGLHYSDGVLADIVSHLVSES